MSTAVTVARVDEVEVGKAIAVMCGSESIAVFNIDGSFFACTNRCPHAGAPLQMGFVQGTVITCPWHGWRFDLAAAPDAPKDGIIRYPVTVEGENLLLHLPDPD